MPRKPSLPEPVVPPPASVIAALPQPEIPVIVPDASVLIYKDCSGKAIRSGLTEGADNFATMTQTAQTIVPET